MPADNQAFAICRGLIIKIRPVHIIKKRGVPIREQPLLFWNKTPSLPIKITISIRIMDASGDIASSLRC